MKCYAIITRFEGERATLHIPLNPIMLSLMGDQIKKHVAKLEEIGEALEPGKYFFDTIGEMRVYGLKLGGNYWAVACDSDMSLEQQRNLTLNLLFHKYPLPEVAQHLSQFMDKALDPKIQKFQQEIDETRDAALKALDSLDMRGEKISDLLQKTQSLSEASFAFKEKSEDLNRCWPCVIL
ncbi:R-SNARE family protein [Legionella erythra]|uniref:Synaptobrevin n=1 Tax=Legionella erythra TaxID=448 RepID=A0A0W0TQ87_LEGER|nr:R-SNARE family protein [Legionella erythra]KTC97745.1 Synaptobrevin [Legionella erythra]